MDIIGSTCGVNAGGDDDVTLPITKINHRTTDRKKEAQATFKREHYFWSKRCSFKKKKKKVPTALEEEKNCFLWRFPTSYLVESSLSRVCLQNYPPPLHRWI